jgi:Tfp pilus assembly protein PilN
MGQFDLNLSTKPFKPYRAINLGLFVLLLILGAVSLMQVYSYQRYSAMAASSRAAETVAQAEADDLAASLQELNQKMAKGNATAKLSEVELLNQLLLRKSFSWTRVFANLERIMPDDVRLVSLRPFIDEQGKIGLNMEIRGRSLADATTFLRALEKSEIFTDVALALEEKMDANEVQFTLSTYYSTGVEKESPAEGKNSARAGKGGN